MSEINVLSRTQIIVVDPATGSVALINAGPPGSGGGGGGGGVGVTDGNKGDITVSDSGDTWIVNDNSITPTKLTFDPATQAELDLVIDDVTDLSVAMALKAPLISPAFTGTPTAPTPAALDNSTKVATTEYIDRFPRLITNDPATYPINIIGGMAVLDLSAAGSGGGGGGGGGGTDLTWVITDDINTTAKMQFDLGSVTPGFTRNLTVPNLSGTLMLLNGPQTVTGLKTFTTGQNFNGGLNTGAQTIIVLDGLDPLGTLPARTDTGAPTLFPMIGRFGTVTLALVGTPPGTLPAGSLYRAPVLQDQQTSILKFAGITNAAYQFIAAAHTFKNSPGGWDGATPITTLGGGRAFQDNTVVTVDTDAIPVGGWVSFRAGQVFNVANGGLATSGSHTSFLATDATSAGITMAAITAYSTNFTSLLGIHATVTHYKINNPTFTAYSASPAAGVTTQYGLDIAALTGANVNVGIRNLSSLRQVGASIFGVDRTPASLYSLEVSLDALGYGVGAGGSTTQLTNKLQPVTLNKPNGLITTAASNLATVVANTFVVNNTYVAVGDTVIVQHVSGGTLPSGDSSAGGSLGYLVWAHTVGAGVFSITVRNLTAGTLGEALVLKFTVIKGSST